MLPEDTSRHLPMTQTQRKIKLDSIKQVGHDCFPEIKL